MELSAVPAAEPAAPALKESRTWLGRACFIAATYGVAATAWIYVSEPMLRWLAPDRQTLVRWRIDTGLAFVVVTTGLLLVVLARAFYTLEKATAALAAKERARAGHEHELQRITRLYAALGQLNQAIAWSRTRDDLIHRVCRVLVEQGGFRLVWLGWHDPTTQLIAPAAIAGDPVDYLKSLTVYGDERPDGHASARAAFRSGRAMVCNDPGRDSPSRALAQAAKQHAIGASAFFPIRVNGAVVGLLAVHTAASLGFGENEIALLTEAAMDISLGLDRLALLEERTAAEAQARREEVFSRMMIESLPGLVYFYNADGRFLRWNKTFEQVSGYTAQDVAAMHPRDFFDPADQPLLESRIAEVFRRGASSVEAPFRSRDGTKTPYYFTGRRVEFDGMTCLVGVGIDITERKRAEAELRDVERQFETVVESLQEGLVITDAPGDLLYWNPSALRLLGFDDPEEGRRQQGRFGEIFELATLDGAILPAGRWPLARARRGDTFEGLAVRVRRRDGDWTRVLSYTGVNLRRPDDRVLAFVTIQDITAQTLAEAERARLFAQEKAARLEAEKAREQVDHILESVTDAFVALDRDWRYTYVNDRAARIFGRRREDLIGKHIWTEFPEGVGQPFKKAYERAMTEKVEIQFEEYYAPYDAWFENRIYPSADGISIVFQDVSARKRAERMLREANEKLEVRVAERTAELKAALLRAEAADRIKSAFLATMSHELRTPLNSIIGFTGIVLQGLAGPLNEEQSKQLGMVRGSARHLLELINDVLDLSKIEAGQLEVRKEPFRLHDAVDRVVATVRPMADKKGLRLSTVIAPEITLIESDRRRVEQILLNLVNNAVKFTEAGEVKVSAVLREQLRLEPTGAPQSGVEISVSDTGIGIRPEDLASLFQPFRQIDTGLSRHHEGTGLGLAICRRLATLLDGRISATSEWGKGSVFTVILPL